MLTREQTDALRDHHQTEVNRWRVIAEARSEDDPAAAARAVSMQRLHEAAIRGLRDAYLGGKARFVLGRLDAKECDDIADRAHEGHVYDTDRLGFAHLMRAFATVLRLEAVDGSRWGSCSIHDDGKVESESGGCGFESIPTHQRRTQETAMQWRSMKTVPRHFKLLWFTIQWENGERSVELYDFVPRYRHPYVATAIAWAPVVAPIPYTGTIEGLDAEVES